MKFISTIDRLLGSQNDRLNLADYPCYQNGPYIHPKPDFGWAEAVPIALLQYFLSSCKHQYNLYSLAAHFIIVKLGFTGVYFLTFALKQRLWVLVENRIYVLGKNINSIKSSTRICHFYSNKNWQYIAYAQRLS